MAARSAVLAHELGAAIRLRTRRVFIGLVGGSGVLREMAAQSAFGRRTGGGGSLTDSSGVLLDCWAGRAFVARWRRKARSADELGRRFAHGLIGCSLDW